MASTRAEILESFLQQLDRLDQEAASLLRSNRRHIAVTAERIADSFAQIEHLYERGSR